MKDVILFRNQDIILFRNQAIRTEYQQLFIIMIVNASFTTYTATMLSHTLFKCYHPDFYSKINCIGTHAVQNSCSSDHRRDSFILCPSMNVIFLIRHMNCISVLILFFY